MLPRMRLAQCVPCVFLLGLALGCGDDSDGGSDDGGTMGTTMGATTSPSTTAGTSNTTSSSSSSTTGGASNVPPDGSAASITAFLEAEGYKGTGWLPVHDPMAGSPHGEVMVYMSPELVAFRQANADPLEAPAVPGSMAVKELLDGATVVGKAAIFYPGADVVYYCYGPAGRCVTGSLESTPATALWGEASAVTQCDGCHGGNVFSRLPAN